MRPYDWKIYLRYVYYLSIFSVLVRAPLLKACFRVRDTETCKTKTVKKNSKKSVHQINTLSKTGGIGNVLLIFTGNYNSILFNITWTSSCTFKRKATFEFNICILSATSRCSIKNIWNFQVWNYLQLCFFGGFP